MIVSKTPLRIGLIGGGSDLPEFFKNAPHGGAVLGIAIKPSVYVTVASLASIAPEKIRFTYRQTESVQSANELEHPVLKAVLKTMGQQEFLNIGTMADLPGETGLGSSSSFTVGLIHALSSHREESLGAGALAKQAIYIEREVLAEAGGWQDQLQAAYGGIRLYEFDSSGFRVSESLDEPRAIQLCAPLWLSYESKSRRSHVSQVHLRERIESGAAFTALEESAELARRTWHSLKAEEDPTRIFNLLAESLRESSRLKAISIGTDWEEPQNESGILVSKPLGAHGGSFNLHMLDTPSGLSTTLSGGRGMRFPVEVNMEGSSVVNI